MEEKSQEKNPIQLRRICYTLNNYTQEELDILRSYSNYKYHLAGFEVGENGTPHIQGYIRFKVPQRWERIKATLPERTHLEPCRGTEKQNISYIKENPKKPEFKEFIEVGYPLTSGTGRLHEVKSWLESGLTLKDVMEEPSIDIDSGYLKLHSQLSPLYARKRTERPEVIWIYGKAGAGKTKFVIDKEGDSLYIFQLEKKWFDGYDQHEAILWDDFDLDFIRDTGDMTGRDKLEQQRLLQRFLSLCDRYEFRGNVKGSSVQIVAKRIYIVSHIPPWFIWKVFGPLVKDHETPPPEVIEKNGELAQVMRRLTSIIHIELDTNQKITYPEVTHVIHGDKQPSETGFTTVTDTKQKKPILTIFKK